MFHGESKLISLSVLVSVYDRNGSQRLTTRLRN